MKNSSYSHEDGSSYSQESSYSQDSSYSQNPSYSHAEQISYSRAHGLDAIAAAAAEQQAARGAIKQALTLLMNDQKLLEDALDRMHHLPDDAQDFEFWRNQFQREVVLSRKNFHALMDVISAIYQS
jgi:hypothetical protein